MITQKKRHCIMLLLTFVFTTLLGASLVNAAPAPTAAVGYVDLVYLLNNHPDALKVNEELKALQEQLKKEFETKSVGLGDKEKRELDLQLGQQFQQRRQEMLKPIMDKIDDAIKQVRVEKGLAIVIAKNIVVDGGVDITADVQNRVTGK